VNRLHNWYCNRESWKSHVREELVPPAIADLDLAGDVLEVGPGFGPATEVLSGRAGSLTALEIDPRLAQSLRERLGDRAEIVQGDGTAMPFADASFDVVACFTMLHHVPSPAAQDRLFAEVARVLRTGGAFVGTDSLGRGIGFWVLHIGDTKVLIPPAGLPGRLAAAGLRDVQVRTEEEALRFSARR
jgi:SAM-dependent methyltransferase